MTFETLAKSVDDTLLAIATIVLAGATIALVKYTRALSTLTRELVAVEKARDEQAVKEKRLANIARCLELVEQVRDFPAFSFGSELKAGTLPAVASQIRALTLLAPGYIRDPETVQHLKELRQWIDTVQTGGNIGGNEEPIRKLFQSVQERSGWSITEWRDELEAFKSRS